MSFKFENLKIWQLSMELGEEMNLLAENFPAKENFNLSSQLRRASDSIALNIAEGSILQSSKENSKFLGYAIRSLAETVTCLHKAKNRLYINELKFQDFYQRCFNLMNMTVAYRDKIAISV